MEIRRSEGRRVGNPFPGSVTLDFPAWESVCVSRFWMNSCAALGMGRGENSLFNGLHSHSFVGGAKLGRQWNSRFHPPHCNRLSCRLQTEHKAQCRRCPRARYIDHIHTHGRSKWNHLMNSYCVTRGFSVGLYFSIILQLHGGVETGGGLEELRGQQHQWMAIYRGSPPEIRLFEKLFVVRASCCSW